MYIDFDKIRKENIIEYGAGVRHLSFLGRLYADKTHFIFELLQNAEDAKARKIKFLLYSDRLEILHDGRIFNKDDVIILDGRTVSDISIYRQGPNLIEKGEVSGGKGNGNGILDPGEEVLAYIRLAKGMAPNDTNTFHRTSLINVFNDPFLSVNRLQYDERLNQASKTHIGTFISVADDTPDAHEFDLWFKVESLYNDKNDPVSRATIYAHKYDYRRLILKIDE